MPIARFELPDGRIGRFEVPEGTTPEEAQKMIAESLGEIQATQAQPQQQTSDIARAGQLLARGAAPVAAGAGLGAMVGGAPGALIGSMALPIADLAGMGSAAIENVIRRVRGLPETQGFIPSQAVSRGMAQMGLPEPTSTGERVIEAAGGGLAGVGTQLPALGRLATTAATEGGRNLAARLAQAPVAQTAVAAPAAGTAQYVGETTENPLLGMAAGAAVGATAGIRPRQVEKGLTPEQLRVRADIAYRNAEKAGVIVSPESLQSKIPNFEDILRKEGYSPRLHPQIDAVISELQTASSTPKTLQELETLRKIVRSPTKTFDNPDQQRIASRLLDEFDDYVESLSNKDLVKNRQDVVRAAAKQSDSVESFVDSLNRIEKADPNKATKELTKARNFYSRSKKADEFADLLERAEIRAGANFTQSGLENALRQELKSLALNKKKLAKFSQAEQNAIKAAAEGKSLQNFLRQIGKYAPTSPIPSVAGGGAGAAIGAMIGGPVGAAVGAAAVPATGALARDAATRIGLNRFREIQEMISLGRMPEVQPRTRLVPATTVRGLLSSPMERQRLIEEETNLGQ